MQVNDHKSYRLLLLFSLTCSLAAVGIATAWPDLALARSTKLSPAKVKQIKRANKSFNNCRKDALTALKDGAISKKKFEVMLYTCQENFPGASLYVACKKAAVKTAAQEKIAPDAAAAQCERYLLAASFDTKRELPYFSEKGQLYFAGIGLNKEVPIKNLAPPNFDCELVAAVAADPKRAQYLLFGNHPSAFSTLSKLDGKALAKTLGVTKPKKKGVDVTSFGRVFGDPAGGDATVFFPTATCDFDGKLGDIFSGLSAYYLLDRSSASATPYFGIAYYKPGQKALTTPQLVQATIKALGVDYKSFKKGGKSKNVTFIATQSPVETDEEHDPKNVCKTPRDQRFIAIVQGLKEKPAVPEYLIVANIKNLCTFGDRIARRRFEQ
jgi:hypothetical protein